jgi:hypothetical protein
MTVAVSTATVTVTVVAAAAVAVVMNKSGAVLHVALYHERSKVSVCRAYRETAAVMRGHERYSLQRQMV